VTRLLIDTSVLIKWFHSHGETEVPRARALRTAHLNGGLDAHVLDLAYYELGNVLIRALGWTANDVADQLDDLTTILGPPLVMTAPWFRSAAELAHTHALSFYDAAWAAAAQELAIPLVSADRKLLAAGLAQTPTDIATRLSLPTT
jgi:predicted nucleic acid-binding protein